MFKNLQKSQRHEQIHQQINKLNIMNPNYRIKLNPFLADNSYLTPQGKSLAMSNRYSTKNRPRFKTETYQRCEDRFTTNLSHQKPTLTNQKDPNKEYQLLRRYQLRKTIYFQNSKRKSIGRSAQKQKNHHRKTPLIKKSQLINTDFNLKIQIKDLQNNILHISRIITQLSKPKQSKLIIQTIKDYILQQQSDLNDIQQAINDQQLRISVKRIIYYERIVIILIVEGLIYNSFKANEGKFHEILLKIINFYSLIYKQIANRELSQFLAQRQFKDLSIYTQNLSPFSLLSIKNFIIKKTSVLMKQNNHVERFANIQLTNFKQYSTNLLYYNLLQYYANHLAGGDWRNWGIQFLQTCPSPYLHHTTHHRYTILLDLDETLVHYKQSSATKGQFLLRPYLFEFLSKIEKFYEVGVFTCALKEYADLILDHLPAVTFRLYRQHTIRLGKQLVKDLSRVGRDLSRLLLIDNLDKNFRLQKQNGIHLRSWYGDPKDTILKQIGEQLEKLSKEDSIDLRLSKHRRSFL